MSGLYERTWQKRSRKRDEDTRSSQFRTGCITNGGERLLGIPEENTTLIGCTRAVHDHLHVIKKNCILPVPRLTLQRSTFGIMQTKSQPKNLWDRNGIPIYWKGCLAINLPPYLVPPPHPHQGDPPPHSGCRKYIEHNKVHLARNKANTLKPIVA